MSFEKFSYVGVLPIPQLICTNLAQNYPIYLRSQAWIHVLWKRIISHLCYLGMPSNTHLLNLVNILVIVKYAYD